MRFFPRFSRRDWLFLLALTALYFVLNLFHLTRLPIFVDEALYLRWAQIAWHDATWRFISLTDGKQPLFTWFVVPFLKLIADPLIAGRTASVIAGFFTVMGSAYSGWLMKDKKLAFLTALLAVFSPFLFFYNRFAVMESLLTAFGIWSFAFAILVAKYRRLDLAMILGFVLGFGMLVKSSALFYLLLSPLAYLVLTPKKKLYSSSTIHFLFLILTSWLIAAVIYNVQRLSPWMHVISEKNAFFTVPYREIFADPARLWHNTLDVFRWHFAYSTIPITFAAFIGLYLLFRTDRRLFFLVFAWLLGQLGGTAAVARLYAPRYIAFVTPFVLLPAAHALSCIKQRKRLFLTTILLFVYPTILIGKLVTNPERFPFVPVDEGYINGWPAGYGVKEVSDYFIAISKDSPDKIYLYTEGTFGILPHGVELYVDGSGANLNIEGIYPLPPNIVPQYVLDRAKLSSTYMLINNTELSEIPLELKLVNQWNKAFGTSMRLYQVIASP